MTRRFGPPAAALAALAVACTDATPPGRMDSYEFRISLESGFPLIFRWPASSLPVRVWAQPFRDFGRAVTVGLQGWQEASLYGEFRGVLVSDSSTADIIVVTARGNAPPRSNSEAACRGSTRVEVALDTTIVLPFRTTIEMRAGFSTEEVDACFPAVVAHELGHALGLFVHSQDSTDLMFGQPRSRNLSARDRATFATLYHTTPTVRLPPGR